VINIEKYVDVVVLVFLLFCIIFYYLLVLTFCVCVLLSG
jgi:hypothetical protein